MVRKKAIRSVVGGAILVASLLIAFQKFAYTYHDPKVVTYGANQIPIIVGQVEGRPLPLALHLASKFELELPAKILDTLHTIPAAPASYHDIEGICHTVPSFAVGSIDLGSFVYTNPVAVQLEQTDPNTGTIGFPIIAQKNLLFDLKHDLILISNDKRKLKEDGYDLSKFHRVPIELTPRGAFLIIEANDRSLRFGINTGATLSIINGEKTIFEDFSIEEKNYGPMELYGFDLPQTPEKVDGFLGMDFFFSHLLYFDFQTKHLYIF